MANTLQVHIAHDGEKVFIKLVGEARLDIEDVAYQLDRVVVHHPKVIVVDASGLTFLSSIGMSLFVNLKRTAAKLGGTMKITGVLPAVYEALQRARLTDLFEIEQGAAGASGGE